MRFPDDLLAAIGHENDPRCEMSDAEIEVQPSIQTLPPPNTQMITEIQRLWERAN